MIALPFILETLPTFLDILPGAVERNIAIIAHISLTFIVLKSVQSRKSNRKKFLVLAMFFHFLLNVVAVYSLYLTQNAWISELSAAAFSGLLLLIAYKITKK